MKIENSIGNGCNTDKKITEDPRRKKQRVHAYKLKVYCFVLLCSVLFNHNKGRAIKKKKYVCWNQCLAVAANAAAAKDITIHPLKYSAYVTILFV